MTRLACRLALVALATLAPGLASARPLYFQTITPLYGITPADEIYACGICHLRWTGTGARNPYGFAVEQQLYIGKSITDAIDSVRGDDSDLDGFSNDDELAIHRTLPGFSCTNYTDADGAPANLQTLVTPGVSSCLEPQDIDVDPISVAFLTEVGDVDSVTVEIRNNGDTFPITVGQVSLLPGAPASISLTAPPAPFALAVGESVTAQLTFAPTSGQLLTATLRVASDDPDEPTIDLPITALSFVKFLAPPDVRGACLKDLEKNLERLVKARLRAWGSCYVDELRGVACNAARRDQTVAKAEAKLRAVIGGGKDTHCAAESLSAGLLGLPVTCPAPCQTITQNTIAKIADCAVCQATAATDAMLAAAVGTTPPDLPANLLASGPWTCNRQIVTAMEKSIRSTQKALGKCELSAVLAGTPGDCPAALSADLAEIATMVNDRAAGCADTTGLLGCLFQPPADPACLGTTATQLGTALSETVFGPN